MHIIVVADEDSRQEFRSKERDADIRITYVESLAELLINGIDHESADAFFLLKEGINKEDQTIFNGKPVFINSVIHTLKELGLRENFCRFNGWPTFLKNDTWEITSLNEEAVSVLEKLQWKYYKVADEHGLVSARIISMIINEAYFTLGEDVSSKEEIDVAMKLGTNYPFGPFEWSKKIGLQKVYDLLQKLSETDSRYNVAPAMKDEVINL